MSKTTPPDPLPPPLDIYNSVNWIIEKDETGGGGSGFEGIQGFRGQQGFQGIQGRPFFGTQGRQGFVSVANPDGIQGIQGIQGNQGRQGMTGVLGFGGFVGGLTTVACVLTKATQSVAQSAGGYTAISFGTGTTLYDPNNFHDETTNNTRVTPNIAGLYFVSGGSINPNTVNGVKSVAVGKNGSPYPVKSGNFLGIAGASTGGSGGYVLEANGSTDYFELLVRHLVGGTLNWVNSEFSVHLLVAF